MNNPHRLGNGYAITQKYLASSRASGVAQALEFQTGEYICQVPVAVIGDLAGVEQVITGCQDDIADFDGQDFVLLVELDRSGGTEFLTGFAGTF